MLPCPAPSNQNNPCTQDGTDAEARRRRARLLGLADGEEGEEEGDAEVIAGTDRLQVR